MKKAPEFFIKHGESLLLAVGTVLVVFLFGSYCSFHYQTNAALFPRASYVLEKYVESHDTQANSSERFLQAQIDVAKTNSGEDIAVHPLFDNPDGKTFYFHVNTDLSYHQVDRDQTMFIAQHD